MREIERSAEGCVKQQATGISKICMDLPLTSTQQRQSWVKDGSRAGYIYWTVKWSDKTIKIMVTDAF